MKKPIKQEQSKQVCSAEREVFSLKGNITDEQIIQSARRQRQVVNSRIDVEPWSPRPRQRHGIAAAITVAASLLSFIAGYGIHTKMSQPTTQPLTQVVQVQHDTIITTETVRDTIYQTRIVTKHAKTMTAQVSTPSKRTTKAAKETQVPSVPTTIDHSSEEQMACSMLCDNIPYELLANP